MADKKFQFDMLIVCGHWHNLLAVQDLVLFSWSLLDSRLKLSLNHERNAWQLVVSRLTYKFLLLNISTMHIVIDFPGQGPSQPAPKFVGNFLAFVLNLVSSNNSTCLIICQAEWLYRSLPLLLFRLLQIGPKGLEFARYSLDYHTIRNYLHVYRTWGKPRYPFLA